MTITSTAFQPNELIPQQYSCQGTNINPPLTFSEVPLEAGSLVLVLDDPDAQAGTFTHWLLYDMSPAVLQIPEQGTPATGRQGLNDFGQTGYGGPCPPPDQRHRYRFILYALDKMLHLPANANREELDVAINDHIIAKAELVGLYQKTG